MGSHHTSTMLPAQPARVVDAVRRRARRAERRAYRDLLGGGNRVECTICGWHGIRFAPSFKPRRSNRICPRCKSNERYRALELWLRSQPVREGARLLEVAPIELVQPTAVELGYEYSSVDLMSRRARVRGDLCQLPFADGSFDVVVCFHVLEHIPADVDAMASMARVLTPHGHAVVVVPWDPSSATTSEDPDASPEERQRRFGQTDHVRMYGRDVTARLEAAGFVVDETEWDELFGPAAHRRHALRGDDDRFWLCRRLDQTAARTP